ncbi:protein FAM168A isoform X2 [Agelaius phoeniceus]|uniref:protein FAM168A isoform X2 n=1 Tax=Agelaius phoeniceus TaxID=39638 RepID=UPI0040550EFE
MAVEPRPAHPGWDSRSGLLPPVSLADYSSHHASLNYNSRHVRRLYPCRTTPPSTPHDSPGPVALCPSPACRVDYTTHDPWRRAASGGPRRRGAEHAGSCSLRSGGGCNGPAGGTAPPTPPIPGWRLREQREEEEEEERERESCCTGTGAAAARAAAGLLMFMSDTAGEEHVHLSNGSTKSTLHKSSGML